MNNKAVPDLAGHTNDTPEHRDAGVHRRMPGMNIARTSDRTDKMQQQSIKTLAQWRCLLAVLLISLVIPTAYAGDSTAATAGNAVDEAILKELKAIREVLEKIEKQGLAGAQKRPSRPTTASVAISNKPVMGSASAPVTVVEFADYQCPYCLRFTRTTFPYLKRDYIDTGKVRWVALNLPLPFHKDAKKAAQAAHCAGEQDKFWEMREELFKNPQKLAPEYLPGHASSAGVADIEAFNVCLASDRHVADIEQDAKDAGAVRLTGTPSFIIGKTASDKITGAVVIGAQPLNVFTAAINKALGEDTTAKKPAGKAEGAGAGGS
ncbi:MAG TPA: thioredoxin domain-containing protein [Gammaproteobacteria bacterium]|nr:thioredoxin domain-containing protein [Gammaproteobacteria bacterium]